MSTSNRQEEVQTSSEVVQLAQEGQAMMEGGNEYSTEKDSLEDTLRGEPEGNSSSSSSSNNNNINGEDLFTPPRVEDDDEQAGDGVTSAAGIDEASAASIDEVITIGIEEPDQVEEGIEIDKIETEKPDAPLVSSDQLIPADIIETGTPGTILPVTAAVSTPITAEPGLEEGDIFATTDNKVPATSPIIQTAVEIDSEEKSRAKQGIESVEWGASEQVAEDIDETSSNEIDPPVQATVDDVIVDEANADKDAAPETRPLGSPLPEADAELSNIPDAEPSDELVKSTSEEIPPSTDNVQPEKGDEAKESTNQVEEIPPTLTALAIPPPLALPAVKSTGQETTSADGKQSPSVFASPATPKSALTSVPVSISPSTNDPIVKQIALILKINKELIRLCVDLQSKDLASDALFKDAALRLQSNLAFLASIADRSTKSSNGNTNDSSINLVHNEPFPPTLHAPDSQLPKLYQLLSSLSASSDINNEQAKRQRSTSQDSQRKRLKDQKGEMVEEQSQMQTNEINNTAISPQPMAIPDSKNGVSANGVMGNISNPAQIHSLTQAFGPNAVSNLGALQAHYRGQLQPVVSYMEANIAGFRTLPIQVQLQQMTSVQNAAMQRQRQQSTPPQQVSRIPSIVADPSGVRLANNLQQSKPSTPQGSAFGQMGSPAPITTASPASYSSPQQNQQNHSSAASYAAMQQQHQQQPGTPQSMPPMMSNMPAHIQQHLLQQLQQQQLQNQQLSQSQQTAFAPTPPTQQTNGLTWPPP